jgi:oxygen-dependent protoporphyrinogen oxidase
LPPADGVVLTTPAPVTASLLATRCAPAAATLGEIRHASVVFTTLAFDRAAVPGDLDASGFLVPRDAGLTVTAASWSSTKWERLAGDPVILRVSMGHSHDAEPIGLDDTEVLRRIAADLRTTMGITATPVAHRITRYPDGFPQYAVGHLDRIATLEADLERDAPDIAVCGMAHRGVGIPACVREARAASAGLLRRLGAVV